MKRPTPGRYVKVAAAGEAFRVFIPAPLPPKPPIHWAPKLRARFDAALLALGRLDAVTDLLSNAWPSESESTERARLPVPRSPMSVRHRDNENAAGLDSVDDAERIAAKQVPSRVVIEPRPCLRKTED